MADSFWGDAAEDMHKTAQAKAESFKHHPSGVHFQNAVKHYKKALDAHHSGADDAEVVKHWDRGDKHMAKGEKLTLESTDEDIDEALVSKATLARYKAKSKAKFREQGGISAALDKQDKDDQEHWGKMAALRKQGPEAVQAWRKSQGLNREEVEPVDEGHTIKQLKQAQISHATEKGYQERVGDKRKAKQHLKAERTARDLRWKKEDKLRKESIVDFVMVQDEVDASPYISEIETRCDAIVTEIKNELKKSLFDFSQVDEARKPKPGSPGGSTVDRDVAERFKKEAKEKKQFASAKREIDKLKKKGK